MIKALYQGSKFEIPNSDFSERVSSNQIFFVLSKAPNQTLLLLCGFFDVKKAISRFYFPFLNGSIGVAREDV